MIIRERYCSCLQAAALLGVSTRRVRQLLCAERLTGQKVGDTETDAWLIARSEIKRYLRVRKPYRKKD